MTGEFLTKAKVLAVFHAKGSHRRIGIEEGISPAHVGAIKRGECHREVTGAELRTEPRKVVSKALRKAIGIHPGPVALAAEELGVSIRTFERYRSLYRKKQRGKT